MHQRCSVVSQARPDFYLDLLLQFSYFQIVALTFAAFVLSSALTPLFRVLAIRLNIIDQPNQSHKTHRVGVPYFGGLSIMTTCVFGILIGYRLLNPETIEMQRLMLFILPSIFLGLVGLMDDIRNLNAFPRFVMQVISSLFVACIFSINDLFGTPSTSETLNILISAFWIVGITNSFNFIDNLDGGAGGIAAFSSLALVISALLSGQFLVAGVGALILGGTLGFLIWNLYPARIYLGDAGALFIGCVLAVLLIHLQPTTPNLRSAWLVPIFIMAVPIMDTSVAVISRITRHVSPFQGGRDHLSHRFMRVGLNRRQSALSLWLLSLFFSCLAVALQFANQNQANFLSAFGLFAWAVIAILFFRVPHSDISNEVSPH